MYVVHLLSPAAAEILFEGDIQEAVVSVWTAYPVVMKIAINAF